MTSRYVQRKQKVISDDGFIQHIEEDIKIMLSKSGVIPLVLAMGI